MWVERRGEPGGRPGPGVSALEARLGQTEVRQAMEGLRDGTLSVPEFEHRLTDLMHRTGTTTCPTLQTLTAPTSGA